MADGELILIAGLLLAGGIVASLVADRLRVPGLLLFLGLGMAIGTDGTGWIDFEDYDLARTIGIIALALILFEGGLTAGFPEIRPVLAPVLSMAFVGTLVTAILTGLAATWLLDLSLLEGLLIGAILAPTDGAAIFGLLRGSTLRRRLARTLEGEAGFNDPVAILLVLGFIDWIQDPGYGLLDMVGLFLQQISIGLAVGILVGWAGTKGFQRLRLSQPGLYPVASIAIGALAFGAADVLGGSGFMAVYLAGLALGSAAIPAKQTITSFHQGLAWVAQLGMFLTLGLLVFPGDLGGVALEGAVLAVVVAVLARPLATAAATIGAGYSWAERVVLGWAGLRGAVPVVLATFPVLAGISESSEFFDFVFFAVLVSTLLQGTTFEFLARKLGVTTSEPALPRPLSESGTIRRLGAEIVEYPVAGDDAAVGARVRDLGLPREALVNVIVRGDEALTPRGSTRVEAGDVLHVLVRQEASSVVPELLRRWHSGPIGPPPRQVSRQGRAPVFQVRRWDGSDGDPTRPTRICGITVVERVRTRADVAGGLFILEDGRYAVTGPLLIVGGRTLLTQHARKRLRHAKTDAERSWWEEVIGAAAL